MWTMERALLAVECRKRVLASLAGFASMTLLFIMACKAKVIWKQTCDLVMAQVLDVDCWFGPACMALHHLIALAMARQHRSSLAQPHPGHGHLTRIQLVEQLEDDQGAK